VLDIENDFCVQAVDEDHAKAIILMQGDSRDMEALHVTNWKRRYCSHLMYWDSDSKSWINDPLNDKMTATEIDLVDRYLKGELQ
jgi:hypothetical protein